MFTALFVCFVQPLFAENVRSSSTVPETEAPLNTPSSVAVADNQSKTLEALAAVATGAINSAEHSVEVVKWIFTAFIILVTGAGGLITFLGFKNLSSIITGAEARMDAAVNDMATTAAAMEVQLTSMREQASAVTESLSNVSVEYHQRVEEAMIAMVESMEAVRAFVLAHMPQLTEKQRDSKLQDAVDALTTVIPGARKTHNMRLLVWCYSMRGYIRKLLDVWTIAIEDEEEAVKIAEDYIKQERAKSKDGTAWDEMVVGALEKELPNKYFNLACYYCLKSDKLQWTAYLEKAVALDIEAKTDARDDDDFKSVLTDADFIRLTT